MDATNDEQSIKSKNKSEDPSKLFSDNNKTEKCTLHSYIEEQDKKLNQTEFSIPNQQINSNFKTFMFGSGTSSSFPHKDDLLLKTNIIGNISCPKCKKPCFFNFLNNYDISFECKCENITKFDPREFKNEYLNKEVNISNHCHKHPKETKFSYYCTDCNYDLCKECMNDIDTPYSNTDRVNKKHENHTKINLDIFKAKYKYDKYIEDLMQKWNNAKSKIDNMEEIIKKIQYNLEITKSLMANYESLKCYSLYKSLENAEIFLIKLFNNNNFDFTLEENKIEYSNKKKITSKDELDNINIDLSEEYKSIFIKNMKESNINLYKLTGCNFSNLKELVLTSNNIKDISPLFKCKFPILSTLDLADNPINNEVINLLEELDLPNLITLNLYKTGITNLKIFKLVNKYKKLNIFL